MQYVTEDYRNNMSEPFRGESSVYVYIGLINKDAQDSAKITSSFSGSEDHLYDNTALSTVTSTESDGSITFEFGDFYELNIAGLTILFGNNPTSITVTNGVKTGTYSVYGEAPFSFDDGYTNCHYLKITPNSGKLKIKAIQFGIGLQFSNKQLIGTSRSNVINHISNELPSKRFTFRINNRELKFNKDNPYGYSDYLEEKQEIIYEYGRELADGTVYRIKGGTVLLNDWTSDDYEASFSGVGRLDYLEGEYYKGQYYPDGISAYDLAINVLEDAGETHYNIDESLKGVMIYNPLPICEYREALKMIANACCGTLYEDRNGDICIKCENGFSFLENVQYKNATIYSLTSSLFMDNSSYNYGDAEINYLKANGKLYFLPEDTDYLGVGLVSDEIANGSGQFANNPKIEVSFVSELMMRRMYFTFGEVVPTSMKVTCFHNNEIVNTQTFSNMEIIQVYYYDGIVDAMEIEFLGASPNQRVHLNNIELDGKIAYELTYHDLKEPPKASTLERVTKVNVAYSEFKEEVIEEGYSRSSYVNVNRYPNDEGGETVDISTGASDYGSAIATVKGKRGENLITFDNPYYNYKASVGTITESGTYYVVVVLDKAQEVSIYGQPYTTTKKSYTLQIHEKGVEKTCENVLINSEDMATKVAKWLKDYYDNDVEYSITYRGDPTLDADDLIYLENKFVANNLIRIVEETINTSTGMDFTCTIRARRTSFQVNSNVDEAIVGDFLLGEVFL